MACCSKEAFIWRTSARLMLSRSTRPKPSRWASGVNRGLGARQLAGRQAAELSPQRWSSECEHPLGAPVVTEAHRRNLDLAKSLLADFHSHTGHGVHARVDGTWVGVGREGLFESHEIVIPPEVLEHAKLVRERGETALLVVAVEDAIFGVIGVADQMRPEAAATIDALKRLGVRKL